MEIDPNRVATAALSSFAGEGWRQLSPRYDPLSGEGARLHGGRFNPPDSFPVLYLCQSLLCALAELERLGARQAIGIDGLLPRSLYRYEISFTRVLDLTSEEIRAAVGVASDTLTGPDWTTCQELGAAAHALGVQAISSPSATGIDEVLAVFVQHISPGRIEPRLVEEWRSLDDLPG